MPEAKKGNKSTDTGVYIPPDERVPHDPDNLHRSKAEFLAVQEQRREKDRRMREYEATINKDLGIKTPEPEPKEEAEKEPEKEKTAKPRGRPKNID
jgi:hypothetical protein